jgi:ABC-type antimicrobial peptide transport system permease subunit
MAYSVGRRCAIGVRVALWRGARRVLALVLGRALRLAAAGLVIGLLGAFGLGRLLQSQLVGVSGSDPLTFGSLVARLGAIALLASWLPAWRAARMHPMVALRHE